MKRFLYGAFTALLFTVALSSPVFGSAALELVVGTDTLYVADNGATMCIGTCTFVPPADQNGFVGGIGLSGFFFDGWSITSTAGGSNSPGCPAAGLNGPGCLDQGNINAFTTGASTLTAYFGDTGFMVSPAQLLVSNSVVLQTGLLQTQSAFAFAGALPLGSGVSAPALAGLCGVSLSSGPPGIAAQSTTCAAPAGPYTLVLKETMTTGALGGGFNVNGNIAAAVPEPAALVLFGSVLILCVSGFRRRSS